MSAQPAVVLGAGPVGLFAALALARFGEVRLVAPRFDPPPTDRIDTIPRALLAPLIEFGIHPEQIGVRDVQRTFLSAWASAEPEIIDSPPKVHVERAMLEERLLGLVQAHSRIRLSEGSEFDPAPECLVIDASGRRAVTACSIEEPPETWVARTLSIPGRYSEGQQALRIAPTAEGYFYRSANHCLATIGFVGPREGPVPALLERLESSEARWLLAGLPDVRSARSGRGGKASFQRPRGRAGSAIPVGDSDFACDALSSHGLAKGIADALRLGRETGAAAGAAASGAETHVQHLIGILDQCRFRAAPAWSRYLDYLKSLTLQRRSAA
jgi:hypothetical protein